MPSLLLGKVSNSLFSINTRSVSLLASSHLLGSNLARSNRSIIKFECCLVRGKENMCVSLSVRGYGCVGLSI